MEAWSVERDVVRQSKPLERKSTDKTTQPGRKVWLVEQQSNINTYKKEHPRSITAELVIYMAPPSIALFPK